MRLLYPATQKAARKRDDAKASVTELHYYEEAVMAAAREERAAHAALQQGIKPFYPSWTESDEVAYEARLARWQAASRPSWMR